jgi:hypothetical protein
MWCSKYHPKNWTKLWIFKIPAMAGGLIDGPRPFGYVPVHAINKKAKIGVAS